jgi:DUF1365 family protein
VNSAIYAGWVRHRRYSPKPHAFNYKLFLLSLDLDELGPELNMGLWFRLSKPAVLSFRHSDYLDGQGPLTKQKVWDKVVSLGGSNFAGKVVLLGQLRCFGLYFSPVNFYYCHDQDGVFQYLLAEVSNTPWNERHCYLVDAQQNVVMDKAFHVSPFMNEDMQYRWRFTPLNDTLYLNIDNLRGSEKLFDATFSMQRESLTKSALIKNLLRVTDMTISTVVGIHWEALKLYLKGIPYVPYVKKKKELI